jgi:hypothetical protein
MIKQRAMKMSVNTFHAHITCAPGYKKMWSDSRCGRFTTIHWMEGWMNPRASMNVVEKSKIDNFTAGNRTPIPWSSSP